MQMILIVSYLTWKGIFWVLILEQDIMSIIELKY